MDLHALGHVIPLSQSQVDAINSTRKRHFTPCDWKDNQAKIKKNKGDQYVPRSGIPKPGIPAPSQEKECNGGCRRVGCLLGLEFRLALFRDYWAMGEYDLQRTYLLSCMEYHENLQGRFEYSLRYLSRYVDVCKVTFMKTFGIGRCIVRKLQERLRNRQIVAFDMRGRALKPHRTPELVKDMMRAHLNAFPRYPVHYSREENGQYYLSSDLDLNRMFRMFVELHREEKEGKRELYRRILRESELQIGQPKSDTCKQCDRLHMSRRSPNAGESRNAMTELVRHQLDARSAYRARTADEQRSRLDRDYVVLCVDLQQVLFCPMLTHSDVFYKRQLSCYTYCIYDGHSGNGTMFLWNEVIGSRGVDEVGSCIMEYVKRTFVPLEGQNQRTLVVWSDRCKGQTNNWIIPCVFQLLIYERYFTEVEQKFLVTGHSYLPCDRLFGLIEKHRSRSKVTVPNDWVAVIQNSRPINRFPIVVLSQVHIYELKSLESFIPRPNDLRVTEVASLRILSRNPHQVLIKQTHQQIFWDTFLIRAPHQLGRIQNRLHWNQEILENFVVRRKYQREIPITAEKYGDLISFLPFIDEEYRQFYVNLPHS